MQKISHFNLRKCFERNLSFFFNFPSGLDDSWIYQVWLFLLFLASFVIAIASGWIVVVVSCFHGLYLFIEATCDSEQSIILILKKLVDINEIEMYLDKDVINSLDDQSEIKLCDSVSIVLK